MTTFVTLTIALLSVIVGPYSLVRMGRWSAAAYRDWVIGAACVYVLVMGLVLLLRSGQV